MSIEKRRELIAGLLEIAAINSDILFRVVSRCLKMRNIDEPFLIEYGLCLGIYLTFTEQQELADIKRFYVTSQNIHTFKDYLPLLPNDFYFSLTDFENLATSNNLNIVERNENAQNIIELKLRRGKV